MCKSSSITGFVVLQNNRVFNFSSFFEEPFTMSFTSLDFRCFLWWSECHNLNNKNLECVDDREKFYFVKEIFDK